MRTKLGLNVRNILVPAILGSIVACMILALSTPLVGVLHDRGESRPGSGYLRFMGVGPPAPITIRNPYVSEFPDRPSGQTLEGEKGTSLEEKRGHH